MEKTLIIFDVDDTLLNSMKLDSMAFAETFQELYGQPLATIDWSKYPHVTDTTIFNHAYETLFGKLPERNIVEHFRGSFVKRISQNRISKPEFFQQIPGARSLVEELLQHDDYQVGIATGGWKAPAQAKLSHFGFDLSNIHDSYADGHITREEILRGSMIKAFELHRIKRTVYIGDAIWDVKTTRNMQLDFVGIRFRGDKNVLEEAGARVVIKDYSDRQEFYWAIENATPPKPIN